MPERKASDLFLKQSTFSYLPVLPTKVAINSFRFSITVTQQAFNDMQQHFWPEKRSSKAQNRGKTTKKRSLSRFFKQLAMFIRIFATQSK
jgi:hypothetical protein